MLKTIFLALLPFFALFSNGSDQSLTTPVQKGEVVTGIQKKMTVANGNVAMEINMSRVVAGKGGRAASLNFNVEPNSFFSIIVFNDELRGPSPSSMLLAPKGAASVPAKMDESFQRLTLETQEWGGQYDLLVRDRETGFVFFNVEGHVYDFDAVQNQFTIQGGRLLISKEYATALGRTSMAGTIVGEVSVKATMQASEITHLVDGEVESAVLPAGSGAGPEAGTRPGPDVVVGDVSGLAQFGGSSGTQVGLALGTDSCNFGTVDLNWFQLPSNDHPVIPQNLYRMSGGATNEDRFEQVGQSQVKHAFTALRNNICGLGCNGVGDTKLGSGCSDPYSASLNSGQGLGARAWINPFSGFYPAGDSATPPNLHAGHSHAGPTHRILTEIADLSTSQNAGATYYAEGQYVTPHEYSWCQANPGQCNMNNNVSYRRYNVTGTGSPFSFSPVGSTQREKPAIAAWTGSTQVTIQPDAANDGIGTVAYKVTNPSPGVWHYEYAVYNQNLNRAIQSFSVPVGNGATLTNTGFHAPPQHPGSANDGTLGSAGFSNASWNAVQAGGAVTWASETFAQNQNANAIRWGTLYNFRFDSNRPPQAVNATVGFFKTGSPITVAVQGPSAAVAVGPFSISGRVTRANGQGLGGIYVFLIDSNNVIRTAVTSQFGFYGFDNVPGGAMYTLGASSKRYSFPVPSLVEVNSNLADRDIQAEAEE